jgi:hypothetical protein
LAGVFFALDEGTGHRAFEIGCVFGARWESGGGPPQSKTLARWPMVNELREASWSAPALWRFFFGDGIKRKDAKAAKSVGLASL